MGLDAGVLTIPAAGWAFLKALGFVASAMIVAGIFSNTDCPKKKEKITLYRGVHGEHPALYHAKAGMAVPMGGHRDPELHNLGDVQSIFTSWSKYKDVAEHRANLYSPEKPGVVLKKEFYVDDPQLVPSPNIADPNEGEILVQGIVYGAEVIKQ